MAVVRQYVSHTDSLYESMLTKSTADQAKLQNRFQFIFEAMGQLGTDPTTLTDCSDVLQPPPDLKGEPHFPAGQTMTDVEQAVRLAQFISYVMVD